MKFERTVIDSHYHIYGWYNDAHKNLFETTEAYREGRGFQYVNVCALPCLHEVPFTSVESNMFVALCKLRYPWMFAHGGLCYDRFPVPEQMDAEMDPLTQYQELMEIGFDGIKMLETKPTEMKAIGRKMSDPLYEPFFAAIEKAGTHMVWHVADPLPFWDPANAPESCKEAGWWYGDGTFPTKEEIYEQVLTVLDRHPKLNVTFAHFFFLSDEVERLEKIFATYPNVCVDLTPGVEMYGSFGKDSAFFRSFFTKYADRLVYGTDASDWGSREGNWEISDTVYRFLTTGEDFDIWNYRFKGLALGDEALDKILQGNFLRKVAPAPKPVNVDALKAYVKKYRHLVQSEQIGNCIDEELAKL